jgi:hypothetical protein
MMPNSCEKRYHNKLKFFFFLFFLKTLALLLLLECKKKKNAQTDSSLARWEEIGDNENPVS